MRMTISAVAVAVAIAGLVTGCSAPNKLQPAPRPYRDPKIPVAMERPSLSQRVAEQRHRAGEVASGNLAVDGQLTR